MNLTVSSGPAIPLDAEFSADKQSGKAPLAVQFVDLSTSSLTITSHEWDFGDPSSGSANTSTQPNPSHAYSQPGIYTVTLSVANAADSDVEVKQQYITVTPADTWQLFVPFFGDGNAAGINSASSNGAATLLCVQNLANEFAQLTISYGNPQGENVNPNAGVPSEITLGPYQLLAWRPSQADTDYEFNGPVGDSTAGNGTVLIESTQPVAGCVMTWSFFNTPEFGNSERDLTAYTMPSKATSKLFVPHFDDPGAARFEPLTSKNLASFIGVQNTGDSAVSIDPAYYLPSGLPTSRSDSNPYLLAAGATVGWRPLWHYDLGPAGQEGPGYVVRDSTEGRGGVLITSSTDGAALAGRLVRYDFQKGAVASYTLPSDGSTKLYAPFYSDFGSTLNDPTPSGTATLLSVQNILATAGTFSVAYYDANGSPAGSFQNIPISPFSSVNWRPARQDPAETALATPIAESTADNGSAVIQSDSTLVGRVMIIDNNANALATAAYTMPGGGSTKLAVPIFLDNGTWHTGAQTAAGYAALIAVQNLSSAPINMSVSYYNVDGDLITDVQDADDEVPFVLAGYSGVSWRPFSDLGKNSGLPNGEGSGRKIVDASEVTGTAIIEATGPIAGRALIYDYSHFGEYGLAAYALPPADPNPKGAKP